MSVINFSHERRKRRSTNAHEAITLQLEHILEQQGLQNFTLSDSRGLPLAYAGDAEDARVLCAYAPLIARCTDKGRYFDVLERIRSFVSGATEDAIAFRSFVVDGETLHLAILGKKGRLKHADIYRAVSGVRRILDQTRVAA